MHLGHTLILLFLTDDHHVLDLSSSAASLEDKHKLGLLHVQPLLAHARALPLCLVHLEPAQL